MRDAEVLIERPDGSRVTVAVSIAALKNQCQLKSHGGLEADPKGLQGVAGTE